MKHAGRLNQWQTQYKRKNIKPITWSDGCLTSQPLTPLQLIVAQKMRGEEGEDLIYYIGDGKYVSVYISNRGAIEQYSVFQSKAV